MKQLIAAILEKHIPLKKNKIEELIEIPKDARLGDYAFPCFSLAGILKKIPQNIAADLIKKIKLPNSLERIESAGPYINFFINRNLLAAKVITQVLKEKSQYGSSDLGKGKTIVIDMSSPNIAKPFGIGHLRSTIIGNSISKICSFSGFKTIKINYPGDWGTPFGKIIAGYKEFGNPLELEKNPLKHLYEIYVKVSKEESYEEKGKEWFRKLESGDKEAMKLWAKFRELSLKDFEKIYNILGISFDEISGESFYNNKMGKTIIKLEKKKLLEKSNDALIVNLEKYGLGVCLIKKTDGTTLYATRDLTAAIDRYKRYTFFKMFYEVGGEQKLHFKQIFKVLELMGYKWAKNCYHVDHGLYLDKDGKKFSTRKGKTIFMEDILNETIEIAKQEILKREKISGKELEERAHAIAISAILYGDLSNFRSNDMIFDIERFLSFEGDTGPYLLYTYARARSILKKANYSSSKYSSPNEITNIEKRLIFKISQFPETVHKAYLSFAPNLIANYSYDLAKTFNEFYHSSQVIGSKNEKFKLVIVDSFSQILKNALSLLGINVIERM